MFVAQSHPLFVVVFVVLLIAVTEDVANCIH